MDPILRTYAHTAWTPADPLAGIEPDVRRAILMMPSTFRERWKLAPWTSRHHRRMAISDIVAERRLLYELTHQKLEKAPDRAPPPLAPPAGAEPTSPYYRYRLALHHDAMAAVRDQRVGQDQHDRDALPEARADHERRATRRHALLQLDIERAKLDVKELEILADRDASSVAAAPLAANKPARTRPKRQDRGR